MTKKVMFIAVAVLLSAFGFGAWTPKTEASGMFFGPYAPEGIRIPASIELLADTPYFASADQPDNNPEGVFSPQTVKVLKTQAAWSIGAVSWQIETMFGPRWIRPKPWEIDIAPPERITLLEETSLYESRSERGGPVASLTAQEVQVTGAEKQWFYTNEPGSKAWIQVHTTWLGDLWAHIPVNRIGTVQKVQPRRAFYYGNEAGSELGRVMGLSAASDGQSEQKTVLNGEYKTVAEFTTVYDRAFQVQTNDGLVWIRDEGIPIIDTKETLTLSAETPLVENIWKSPFKELAVLSGEKVTAYEKVEVPLWGGRGPNPFWNGSTWYHVRTSKGTGWVNPMYGEPASAVPVHWKAELKEQHELFRYPGIPYESSTLILRQQTVQATAAWDDPNGFKWLKVAVDGRSGWIQLYYASQERIWDEDAGTALQIPLNFPNGVGLVRSDDGKINLYNQESVGYTEDGNDYFEAVKLAEQLRFTTEKISYADAVKFSQGDYAFQLESGMGDAVIYWHGSPQRTIQLTEHPRRTKDGWYLNWRDLRTLFGLSRTESVGFYYLFAKDYKVEFGKLPTAAKNGRLDIQAFLYDQVSPDEQRDGGRMPVLLSIEENGDRGGETAVSREEAVLSGTDRGKSTPAWMYRLTSSRALTPGTHQVDLVLRAGERIVWKQTITVTAE